MGFFSWLTADTHETIWNHYTVEGNQEVYLCLPDNTTRKFLAYDGYGRFINPDNTLTDIHVLLAEWHGYTRKDYTNDQLRDFGVHLEFGKIRPNYFLKFSFKPNAKYTMLPPSENCPNQGFFGGEIVLELGVNRE
jgi:hypothetical protein